MTTSSQKILDKLERKDKRRAGARGTDADLDWLATRGFDELVEAEVMRASKCAADPFVSQFPSTPVFSPLTPNLTVL